MAKTTKAQERPIVIGTPVEIGAAINALRVDINNSFEWITHPYFIAQRFVTKEKTKVLLLPEVYAPEEIRGTTKKKLNYKQLTPDNDFAGLLFAYIGNGRTLSQDIRENFIQYDVAFIFAVNLELIDKAKLTEGLFTRELMSQVRKRLALTRHNYNFKYDIIQETDDLKTVFREFLIDELEQYNRAPMQCFRFDLKITVQEDCP